MNELTTLKSLMKQGATELDALNTLSRMRTQAVADGKKVTRVIRDGKVQEQYIK